MLFSFVAFIKKSAMKNLQLSLLGRIFYGVGIAGIGLTHFLLPGLRPIMAPIPPEVIWAPVGNLVGLILILAGLAIALGKATRIVCYSLAAFLLLFVLLGHLPNRLKYHPEILGYWTDTIKLIALVGGALVLSNFSESNSPLGIIDRIRPFARHGKYLYTFMLVIFGLSHLINVDLIAQIIPEWIPFHIFWTYLTGIALIGAGLSIFINVKVRLIMHLLTLMLLLWLIVLHLPATIKYPLGDAGLLISLLQVLCFSGTSLFLANLNNRQRIDSQLEFSQQEVK